MNARVDGQLMLPREPMKLDEAYIASRKSLLHAFVSAADLGGLEDKQAAAAAARDVNVKRLSFFARELLHLTALSRGIDTRHQC